MNSSFIGSCSEVTQPLLSPYVNPLDFWFLGRALAAVFSVKPSDIPELKVVEEEYTENLAPDEIGRATGNDVTHVSVWPF